MTAEGHAQRDEAIAFMHLVAVHSHIRKNARDRGGAAVHLFRFQNGRIAELRDVGQAIPPESPNEFGMF